MYVCVCMWIYILYSHNHDHDQLYKDIIHIHLHMHAESTTQNKDEQHSLLEKYTSHFIWKVCVWKGVGDRTELQHIDHHSIGHNRVSFPFTYAAQPAAWGHTMLGAGFLYHILSPTDQVSKLNRGSPGPLLLGAGFLYHIFLQTNWLPVFTE